MSRNFHLWICVCAVVISACLPVGYAHVLCDGCECTVSNPSDGDRAVLSLKPRCQEGQVTWLNANGALRLELGPLSGDTQYCLRLKSDNVETVVSQEVTESTPGNYRLKIVDSDTFRLSPLFTTRGQGREFCTSGSDSLHLYVETERAFGETGVPRVKIHYDIERRSNNLNFSPMDECRPCTDKELLRAYCTSDFVAVGTMDDVTHDDDKSAIRVSVDQLVSQNEAVFLKPRDGWSRPHELKGVVHVPRNCGIRHGDGQFLFTGRVRLGQPMIQCAPRYEQWKELMTRAMADDTLECSYG